MEFSTSLSVMTSAQRGDALAMEQLLRRTYPVAAFHCGKFLDEPALRQQTLREILTVLCEKLNHLESAGAYTGFVNRICARQCVNALRRSGAELRFTDDWDPMPEEPDTQLLPDPALDNPRTAIRVEEAVDALPTAERLCLYLHYCDELSTREIAHLFEVTEQNIVCTLKEARLLLGKITPEGQPISLSPLPYLHYFLTCRVEEWYDPAAARTMVRGILEGKEPPAESEIAFLPEAVFDEEPEEASFPDIQPLPVSQPEEAGVPMWLIFSALLLAVALGLAAAVYSNGASFSQLMENILGYLF